MVNNAYTNRDKIILLVPDRVFLGKGGERQLMQSCRKPKRAGEKGFFNTCRVDS
jgi:hypothetical protein